MTVDLTEKNQRNLEVLFRLLGRLHYRQLVWQSQHEDYWNFLGNPAQLNAEEKKQFAIARAALEAEPELGPVEFSENRSHLEGGNPRHHGSLRKHVTYNDPSWLNDIDIQAADCAKLLFGKYGTKYHPTRDIRDFDAARMAYRADPTSIVNIHDPLFHQRAGFISRAAMIEHMRRASAVTTGVLHEDQGTPESVADEIEAEGNLKKRGQLLESGATDVDAVGPKAHVDGSETSESFLNKLHGHHSKTPVEIMTHAGWRNALEVQAEERAKAPGQREV